MGMRCSCALSICPEACTCLQSVTLLLGLSTLQTEYQKGSDSRTAFVWFLWLACRGVLLAGPWCSDGLQADRMYTYCTLYSPSWGWSALHCISHPLRRW